MQLSPCKIHGSFSRDVVVVVQLFMQNKVLYNLLKIFELKLGSAMILLLEILTS